MFIVPSRLDIVSLIRIKGSRSWALNRWYTFGHTITGVWPYILSAVKCRQLVVNRARWVIIVIEYTKGEEGNGEIAVSLQPRAASRLYQNVVRWARDFPILYKILVANSVLVMATITVGAWLGTRHISISADHTVRWEFVLWFGAAFLSATILVNYALLRAALQPLSTLTRLIAALRRGEMDARAERPLLGDPKLNLLIETANTLLDDLAGYRRRVDDLSKRVTTQLETERWNIARELHDETAQNLATLLVLEQMIAQAHDDAERARAIEDARQLTRLTLEGVRRMSIGLRPTILDDVGVQGALRWYVEELMGNVLPEVSLDLDGSTHRLASVTELALYRIAQEALSNVARHAQATKVRISLKRDGDEVVLRIADDGIGFDPNALLLNHREHLGLFTIKERARLASGEAEVTSQPGKGTTVVARLPAREHRAPLGRTQ